MKIFILAEQIGNDWHGFALAEDGTGLAGHISSSLSWLKSDMGLRDNSHYKHTEYYIPHTKGNYELIDLTEATEDELESNTAFQRALKINRGQVDA